MSNLYKVALVGRPNVGKSALFNRLVKKRVSIVDAAEGVTRDRIYGSSELFGKPFELIDTGGIASPNADAFQKQILFQTEVAIEEADSLVMVVDATIGITDLDQMVARKLLKVNKPIVLAVNKVDDESKNLDVYNFYSLGIEDVVGVSAKHGYQVAELLEKALKHAPNTEEIYSKPQADHLRLALVGRPNVGKSTLLNKLLKEERSAVSDIAGTTRDSIDATLYHDGQKITLIDTAGIRKKNKEKEAVEKFAAIRTEDSIERADVCLLMIDSREGLTSFEKRIISKVQELGKGLLIISNKWDLVSGFRMEHCSKGIYDDNMFVKYCPLLFISAKDGRNVDSILQEALEVFNNLNRKVSTSELNRFMERALQFNHPPMIRGKRLRVYYMTQVGTNPIEFSVFINYQNLLAPAYFRYLKNTFRESFAFKGCPVKFHLRDRKKQANRNETFHIKSR